MLGELNDPLLKSKTLNRFTLPSTQDLSHSSLSFSEVLNSTLQLYLSEEVHSLHGHSKTITSVSISPDGRTGASVSTDSLIKLWNLDDYSEKASLQGHNDEIWSVIFSNSGKHLITGSKDMKVIIWDVFLFSKVKELEGHSEGITCLAVSPSDTYILSGSTDCSIKVWSLEEKSLAFELAGHKGTVKSLALSRTGELLASGSGDRSVKIWDFSDRNEVFTIECDYGEVNAVAISCNNKEIIGGTDEGKVVIWDLETRSQESVLSCHSDSIYSLVLSRDGKTVITGSADLYLKVLDIEKRVEKFRVLNSEAVSSVDIEYNGKVVILGLADGLVKVINTERKNEIVTFSEHQGCITYLSLTFDNEYLLSSSSDNNINIWNLNTLQLDSQLKGHTETVSCVLVSKNNRYVFSSSYDGLVKIWNFPERIEEKCLEDDIGSLYSLSLSHSEKLIASGGSEEITVWELDSSDKYASFQGNIEKILCLSFSIDDSFLFSGSSDKTIRAWSTSSKRLEFSLDGHSKLISSLLVTRDGSRIISSDTENHIKIWNISSKLEEFSFNKHSTSVTSLDISNDGRYLISASKDGVFKVWNLQEKREEFSYTTTLTDISSLKYLESDKYVIVGSDSGLISIVDLKDRECDDFLSGHLATVTDIDLSSDSKYLISCGKDKLVKLWNLEEKIEEFTFDEHKASVNKVKFSPNGAFIASAGSDSIVNVWDVGEKEKVFTVDCEKPVHHVQFSHDSENLAFVFQGKTVRIINFATKDVCNVLNGHKGTIRSFDYSPDSKFLFSGGEDLIIKVWNLQTGTQDHLEGHKSPILALKVSPNGRRLVSSGVDKYIKVWDLKFKREEFCFIGNSNSVNDLKFSVDGSYVISASADGFIRVWNLIEKRDEFQIKENSSNTYCAVPSKDGRLIITGGQDGLIKIWALQSRSLVNSTSKLAVSDNDYFNLELTDFGTLKVSRKNKKTSTKDLKLLNITNDSLSVLLKEDVINFDTKNKAFCLSTHLQMLRKTAGKKNLEKIIRDSKLNKLVWGPEAIFDSFYFPKILFLNFLSCLQNKSFSELNFKALSIVFSPFLYTLCHVWAFLGNDDLIKRFVSNHKDLSLKVDVFGKSPLYYSIINKNQDCTDQLLKFLVSIEPNSRHFFSSLHAVRNEFSLLIESSAKDLGCLLEKLLISSSHLIIRKPDVFPYYHFHDCLMPDLSEFALGNSEEQISAVFQYLPFKINSLSYSEENIGFLESIYSCTNKDIFETRLIRYLVDANWKAVGTWMGLYSFLQFLHIILFLVLYKNGCSDIPYLCYYVIVTFLLFVWQIFQLIGCGLYSYITNTWNILESITFCLSIYWIVALFLEINTEYEALFLALCLFSKGLSAFRSSDEGRYYINLVLFSLYSIRHFLVILFYSTFFFSVLLIISNKEEFSFETLWGYSWSLNFNGELKENSQTSNNVLNYSVIFALNIINLLLLLNMLISILGNSFDQIQANRVFNDYKQKLQISIEIQKTVYWKRRTGKKKYFHVLKKRFEESCSEWLSSVGYLEKKNEKGLVELKENIQEKVEEAQKGIRKSVDDVSHRIEVVEGNILGVQEKLGNMESSIKKILDILAKKH